MINPIVIPALVGAGSALALNLLFTPALVRLSHRYGWYDEVNHRKIHTGKIPRIGGVGISASFLVVTLVFVLVPSLLPHGEQPLSLTGYFAFVAAFLIVHILGIVDDFADLRPRIKIIVQSVAALIVTFFGHSFTGVYIPVVGTTVFFGPVGYALTFVWILGMCNAVNLIDGLDGLAGGVTAIAALFMGFIFALQQSWETAFFAFALSGAIVGFLFFNMPPARLFMGDSGALAIGFTLACLPLLQPEGHIVPGKPILLSITVLLIPILDTIAAILRRIRRRIPIQYPDREHIHHKLLDLGVSNRGILAIIYTVTFILGISSLYWVLQPADSRFLWVFVSWLLAVGLFLVLDVLAGHRRSAPQRKG